MRSLWVVVALAGCLEPSLVPCDETLCPVGTACGPGGGCVAADQLTACLGLEEREECEITAGSGVCMMGVCQPKICGNGFETSDEICDDGNNVNGDGCSADCQSDEACGNGITDPREGCDDGNGIDADDCRNDCSLPRCGDATVDPLEECEAAVAGTGEVTCDDFGFYEGDVTCGAQCRYVPTSCEGRCDDGIVQERFGEECDGAPPRFSCVEQGFDYGALTCTSRCTADLIADCDRFGWRSALELTLAPTNVYADGDGVVAFDSERVVVYRGDNVVYSRRLLLIDADVAGDTALLVGRSTATLVTGSSAVELPALPVGTNVLDGALDPDGTVSLLATSSGSCAVYRLAGGSWGATAMPAGCDHLFVLGDGEYVVQGAELTWVKPTTTLAVGLPARGVFDIVHKGAALAAYNKIVGTVERVDISEAGVVEGRNLVGSFPSVTSVAVHRGIAYAVTGDAFSDPALYRAEQGRPEPLVSPGPGPDYLFTRTRDGRLLLYANNQLWEPRRILESARTWPSSTDLFQDAHLDIANDDSLVLCGSAVHVYSGAQPTTFGPGGGVCTALLARTAIDIYLGWSTSVGSNQIYRYTNAGLALETHVSGRVLEIARENEVVVVVDALGGMLRKQNGTWSALPSIPSCFASHIALANGTVFAACDSELTTGGLFELVGTTWTQRATDTISALVGRPSGLVVYAGVNSVAMLLPGASTFTTLPSNGSQTRALAAALPTDVLAVTDDGMQQWNGTAWSPIKIAVGRIAMSKTEIATIVPVGTGFAVATYRGYPRVPD